MRASGLLLATAAGLAVTSALSTSNGRVDEEHNAIVVEAIRPRSGRAFSWFSGTPSSPFAGMFPASTQPLALGQQTMCRTASGALAFCQSTYNPWGSSNWRVPQAPQQQYPWAAQYPGQFGQPGIQQPGWPGQPGWGQPQPPQQPGWGQPQPPQQPDWQPPQQPDWQQPQQPVWQQPQPVQPQPQPVQPVQPVQPAPTQAPITQAPVTQAPVTQAPVTQAPVTQAPLPAGASPGQCGVSRYFPIRYDSKTGRVAEEVERENEAGAKIRGGWDADKGEWPWIAQLLNNGRQFCGGSLITRKHILTAAHCVAHMSRYDVANLKVRLGDHAIKTSNDNVQLFESKAARVVRHKEFSQQTLHKDVAIITLTDEVPEMANVRPVCLESFGGPARVGQTATVVGWGSLRENGPQPDILQEITVKIWDNKECKDTYGPAAPGGIMDHMLCAGQAGKDSCSGDSGGPMQIGNGDTWTQIGVVSWGIGCGKSQYPGVYSRVASLRDWIDKITNDY